MATASTAVRKTLDALYGRGGRARLVSIWSNGSSWYRKYSDGWIEQGGYVSNSNSSDSLQTVSVSFHVSFSGTDYVFIRSTMYGAESTNNIAVTGYKSKSASGVSVNVRSSTYVKGFDWYACGY